MTTLDRLRDPIRGVQEWERRTRLKTRADQEIEGFYIAQIAALEQAEALAAAESAPGFWNGAVLRSARAKVAGLLLVPALAAGLALAFTWAGAPEPNQLTFAVSGGELAEFEQGSVDRWLGEEDSSARLSFSDGTRVTLPEGAQAKVDDISAAGAEIQLKRGTAKLDVVPRDGYQWGVNAGPFHVSVKGTVFVVAWDPDQEQLAVTVERGAVSVQGGHLGTKMLLVKGQKLVVSAKSPHAVLSVADAAKPVATVTEPTFKVDQLPASEGVLEDAKSGRLIPRAVVAETEQSEEEEPKSSAEELMKQADVARATGQHARAARLLIQIRQQYPGSAQSSLAAYSLGVTEFLHRGSSVRGARWFRTYLRESPGGPLAREALGQLMEAQLKLGNRAAAQGSAKKYLKSYPGGPHRNAAVRLAKP